DDAPAAVEVAAAPLRVDALRELAAQGVAETDAIVMVRAHIPYSGTDTSLPIAADSFAAMKDGFEQAHRRRFGFIDEDKSIVIDAIEVEAIGGCAQFEESAAPLTASGLANPLRPIK